MKLLRKYIRELLTEGAKGPADLPEDAYVVIRRKSGVDEVYYAFEDGSIRHDVGPPDGLVSFARTSGRGAWGHCLRTSVMVGAMASSGWGPLLYDVAIEVAGARGLAADRESLSQDAYDVWFYYMNSRPDVQKIQLDSLDNELTPDDADNCTTKVAREFDDAFDFYRDDEKKKALIDSPVMKVYTKEPTTIEKLESMGRLIRK